MKEICINVTKRHKKSRRKRLEHIILFLTNRFACHQLRLRQLYIHYYQGEEL